MNELDKTISKVKNNEFSFAVIKDNKIIHQDFGLGVSCIRKLINTNPAILENSIIVDKVIGKAAAMLLIPTGIIKIHALVISKPALTILLNNNIETTYDQLVEFITNRNNDGMCPLEKSVQFIDDFNEALIEIENTIKILMNT